MIYRQLLNEIRAIDLGKKQLRRFGVLIGLVSIGLGFFIPLGLGLWLIGAALVGAGIFRPLFLDYLYIAWMSIAIILGFFVFRLLLVILYYAAIMPIGIMVRLVRGDVLNLTFNTRHHTYWRAHQSDDTREN